MSCGIETPVNTFALFCKPEITKSIKSKSPEARYFFFALHPKLSNNSFLKKERAD
jgi:hypothetical protein